MLTISQKKFCADGDITGVYTCVCVCVCVCVCGGGGGGGGYVWVCAYLHVPKNYRSDIFPPSYVGHESMLWQVPVTIATSKNPAAIKFVLDSRSTTVTVEGVGPDDWILVCSIKLLSTGGILCRDAH